MGSQRVGHDSVPELNSTDDLNQIPYVYTVEVASRFKRLNLLGRVHEELW